MMTRFLSIVLFLLPTAGLFAQQDSVTAERPDSAIRLQQVEVKGARRVNRPDGLLILPTDAQRQASANGYDLLGKLALPMLRVDETGHSITSVDAKTVQVRVNGAIADKAQLLALDPKLIRYVEYINQPGVRYGQDIGYVLNIRTRRADEGYAVGTDLTNALTTWQGDNSVFARWNHRQSELSLSYDFGYLDSRGSHYREHADYELVDGTHYYIERSDSAMRQRLFSNALELRYCLADSADNVFQATLSADFTHNPGSWHRRWFRETGRTPVLTEQRSRSLRTTPVLDLYCYHALGRHQSVTANVVATSIATDDHQFNDEGSPYAYDVAGRTWSLTAEAVYENRLKPFTLSFGANSQLKYTRNRYTGAVGDTTSMHNSTFYLFGEMKGTLGKLRYALGLGVSNAHYSQGQAGYNRWVFRPKASLTYNLLPALSLTYSFERSQRISQIAMISDTRIRKNALEWTVGNPDIKPTTYVIHDLRLAYSKPRLYTDLMLEWRVNRHPNMAAYERTADNQFLYLQRNQGHINMLYAMSYTQWTIVPERLTFMVEGGLFRFFNRGDNYNHTLTSWYYSGTLQAYLGRWTLMASADNGFKFMEGETWNRSEAVTQLRCSYRFGQCRLSLTLQHPFEAHPCTNRGGIENRYLHKSLRINDADSGNALSLNFSWRLSHGRKFKDIDQALQNSDRQTGIL